MTISAQLIRLAGVFVLAAGIQACSTMGSQQASTSPTNDSQINSQVTAALSRDPTLAGSDIAATTQNAEVRLTGLVDTRLARQQAVQTAADIPGVRHVVDDLRLSNGD